MRHLLDSLFRIKQDTPVLVFFDTILDFLQINFNFQTVFSEISIYSTTQTSDAVYISGGRYTRDIVAEFNNDRWRRLTNLNQGRHSHGSITIGGETMIIGGFFYDQYSSLVTEVWDLKNGTNKIIEPRLPDDRYVYGIALYVVDKDFCKK